MHVCHLCDGSVQGEYFRNMTAGLVSRGVNVTLVELGPGYAPPWLGDIPGAAYMSLAASSKLSYLFAARRLGRWLNGKKVDILHTHLFNSGIIGVLARRYSPDTTVAMMRHHTSVVRMLGSRFHIAADKWMAERADKVLTVSNAAKAYMRDVDGIDRDDIEVVYLGFDFERLATDPDERRRVRGEFGFGDDELVIGYTANFTIGKGHIQLVRAFERIAAELPNARLLLVGRGMIDEVRRAAEAIGEGKVVFAGWRDDVAACLNAMDIFVQPSLSEAFSQVLVEAMGVGLPVIATNVGGASEVITDGVNGVLIEPDNTDAIFREAMRLAKGPAASRSIAEAGAASVRKRFTAEQMVETQYALYGKWTGS